MPWIILLVSAVLEAVWATALGASRGFTLLVPSTIFGVAFILSMLGLGYAAKSIPIGTAYAVWTGVGAALTVAWAILVGGETGSIVKVLLIAGIVGCVMGLKLTHAQPAPVAEPRA